MPRRETSLLSRRRFIGWLALPGAAILLRSTVHASVNPPKTHTFKDAGDIPNNPVLPLLIYPQAAPHAAEAVEAMLARNGWRPAWRYSVYPFPHYHSTAHEVLGIYRGSARLRLGHSAGRIFEVRAGDVIVIPAGVGHENIDASNDFHVVGGYPPDQRADLLRGEPGERPRRRPAHRRGSAPRDRSRARRGRPADEALEVFRVGPRFPRQASSDCPGFQKCRRLSGISISE